MIHLLGFVAAQIFNGKNQMLVKDTIARFRCCSRIPWPHHVLLTDTKAKIVPAQGYNC
jgi:hypothetical protein